MTSAEFIRELIGYLSFIPAGIICYLPMTGNFRFPLNKTIFLWVISFAAYILPASALSALCSGEIAKNIIIITGLFYFFLIFCRLTTTTTCKKVYIYVNACLLMSFPWTSAASLKTVLLSEVDYSGFSLEIELIRFSLSCILVILFAYPTRKLYKWMIDNINIHKVWCIMIPPSMLLLLFNIIVMPFICRIIHSGRSLLFFNLILLVILAMLTFMYMLFYFLTFHLLEQSKFKEQSSYFTIQLERYALLQKHVLDTSKLRHDFKHSLHALSVMAENGEIENLKKYLSQYEQEVDLSVLKTYCKNAALNALFNHYDKSAETNRISVSRKINMSDNVRISEQDLLSLIGNILENAFAGCMNIPEQNRFLSLSIEFHEPDSLYIVSTNSFDGYVRKRHGIYFSTKHNGSGMGLYSIKSIAQKYNGIATFSNTDSEFHIDVMLHTNCSH